MCKAKYVNRVTIFSRTLLSNSVVTNHMWQVGTGNEAGPNFIMLKAPKQQISKTLQKIGIFSF